MRRVTLYSSSIRSRQPPPPAARGAEAKPSSETPRVAAGGVRRWRAAIKRFDGPLWLTVGAALALALVLVHARYTAQPRVLTQEDIDAAVLHTLETKTLPSTAARAYEIIRPSVVRVRQLKENTDGEKDIEKSVGSGVVIVDKGII